VNEFLGGIWLAYKGPKLAEPGHGIWDGMSLFGYGAESRADAQTFVCQLLVLNFICHY
jgi:hypothetical protein